MHVPTEFHIKYPKTKKKSIYSLISPIIAHQKYHLLEDRHILQATGYKIASKNVEKNENW